MINIILINKHNLSVALKFPSNRQIMLINQYYAYYYIYSNSCLFSYFLSTYCNVMLVTIKNEKKMKIKLYFW